MFKMTIRNLLLLIEFLVLIFKVSYLCEIDSLTNHFFTWYLFQVDFFLGNLGKDSSPVNVLYNIIHLCLFVAYSKLICKYSKYKLY